MTILITCKDAKIEGTYRGEFSVDCDNISQIDAEINDVLKHFQYDDVAKYKDIFAVVECLETDKVLDKIDENDILEYIASDDKLIQEFLDMIDEKFIIAKARKLKIENLLQNEK